MKLIQSEISKMWNLLMKIFGMHYAVHLVISLFIRLTFIGYSVYHDAVFTVPYTDIDYKVFTDASRYILNGGSPYDRHTYRYSPILAIILIPNLTVSPLFGKILFSLIDILVALLIRKIVIYNLDEFNNYGKNNKHVAGFKELNITNFRGFKNNKSKKGKSKNTKLWPSNSNFTANISMIVWLYNPLTIAIATRGNCDSIAGFLVLTTVFCIQCKKRYFLGGLVHGLSIHFRLYPIFYSLTFFMFLSNYSFYIDTNSDRISSDNTVSKYFNEKKTIFRKKYLLYLLPNRNQISLVLGCLISLSSLIGIFYHLYGYKFIYETYLYHFVRHDTRHNFSLYFYLQYLTAFIKNIPIWQKILVTLPQIILLIITSVKYGLDRIAMNFGLLVQTVVMVSYNTVLTSQYFVWIMVILPACIWQIKISIRTALFWIFIWIAAQGAWLLPAFLLEFKGQNTFIFIWLQGVAFFCANIAILGRLIMYHRPYDIKTLKGI